MNINYIISRSNPWFLGLLLRRSELSKKCGHLKKSTKEMIARLWQKSRCEWELACGNPVTHSPARRALKSPSSLLRLIPPHPVACTAAPGDPLAWGPMGLGPSRLGGRGRGSASHSSLCGAVPAPLLVLFPTCWPRCLSFAGNFSACRFTSAHGTAGASYLTCWVTVSSFAKWE